MEEHKKQASAKISKRERSKVKHKDKEATATCVASIKKKRKKGKGNKAGMASVIDQNSSISISKVDHDATLKILQSMDWTMAKNTSRRNVIRAEDDTTPRNEMGKPYCMSFIFGRNMKDPKASLSFWSIKYPKVYAELQKLMSNYDPSFQYTHITLNYNLRCKRHTDGGNLGPSYIAAFGNFDGGELIVEVEQHQPSGGIHKSTTTDRHLDLKSRFVKFNGKTQPHETSPFHGDRYTLVYYTSDIVPPLVDRRAVSISSIKAEEHKMNPDSSLAKKFEAIKAKLGQRKKPR